MSRSDNENGSDLNLNRGLSTLFDSQWRREVRRVILCRVVVVVVVGVLRGYEKERSE